MIGKGLIIQIRNKTVKCNSNYVSLNTKFGENITIGKNVKINSKVEIGNNTYINYETIIESNVIIGKYCSIGPQVYIAPGNHPLNFISTHPFLYDRKWQEIFETKINNQKILKKVKNTIIENDVWIGARAIIMEGVHISNGAIIGAGAIVTNDVPPYAIVVGSPAKIIKYRFNEENINKLNKIQWWDWNKEKISREYDNFFDIDKFILKEGENK